MADGLLSLYGGDPNQGGISPGVQGLLSFGLGVLANNHGLNAGLPAIGMGGQQAINTYAGAQQAAMQRQMQQLQMQQLGFQLKKNQLLYDTAQGLLGGGQSATQPQGIAPAVASPQASPVSGAPGPNAPAAAGSAPTPPPSAGVTSPGTPRSSLFGNIPSNLAGFGLLTDPGKLFEIAANQYSPTDLQKQMTAAGIPQGSPLWNQILLGSIQKSNYIAPTSFRAGGGFMRPDGTIVTTPAAPAPGFQNVQQPDGNWATVPVAGGTQAVAASTAASTQGKNSQTPAATQYDAQGNPLPTMSVTQSLGQEGPLPLPIRNNNPGAVSPGGQVAKYSDMQTGIQATDQLLQNYGQQGVNTLAGVIRKWTPPSGPNGESEQNTQNAITNAAQFLGVDPNQPIDLSNPLTRHMVAASIFAKESPRSAIFAGAPAAASQNYPAPPLAASTYAQGQTQQMLTRWNALRDQNSSAQTVISQLQNISQLAPQAITGVEADHRAYVNGLLALIGVPGADSTKTASDLLDKYSNQIVAKLGQGGLGTDAAREIVSAGNPNAHMNVAAIQEAVRNLSGQYAMQQAKVQALMPYANKNDPQGYARAEAAFDAAADPRLFEMKAMPQAEAQAFLKSMPSAQAAQLRQQYQTLKNMGVL